MKQAEGAGAGTRRPIIKKVKKGGHKHHGGSWKVAYADFVTAMMAFFLLMWLLSSVSGTERAQIANYFKRPLSAIFSEGAKSGGDRLLAKSEGSKRDGLFAPGSDSLGEATESLRMAQLQERLEEELVSNPSLRAVQDQVRLEMTDQGLRIQIVDKQQRPMFAMGSATVQSYTRDLLQEIAHVINDVPNGIIISGHTDATPYPGGEVGYSNWELSADRANAARRELVGGGIHEGKILRVEGLSSTILLNPVDAYDPANRRISILLLNRKTEEAFRIDDPPDALHVESPSERPAG